MAGAGYFEGSISGTWCADRGICMFCSRECLLELLPALNSRAAGVEERIAQDQIGPNGIDLRIGKEIAVPKDGKKAVDTRICNVEDVWEDSEIPGWGMVLQPGRPYLLITREHIYMPPGYIGLVNIKSTAARLFLVQPPTVVDAGFEGRIVIEVVPFVPVRIYPGLKLLHLVIGRLDREVAEGYGASGHYQGQRRIERAKCESLF